LPALAERHAEIVARACRTIAAAEAIPRLEELARGVGLSPSHFHRIFVAATGLSPKAYGRAEQRRRVGQGLSTSARVTEAVYAAGFASSGRFYESADRMLGMTPRQFRKVGEGITLRFGVADCSLGHILVAASTRGIAAILLGDHPEELVRELAARFAKAVLIGGDAEFEAMVARVVRFVEAPRLGLDLPLDVRGTAFQQRVWQALSAVPPGTTVSYREIAESLGTPKAVRAVAGACAANPLAVAIPCHRVVRADGALSGYRWGVNRKQALLEKEKESE
jgi:AraC family transcriptional regulator of adaptative response/methylated-DNA-[protein]-cysteine methyltransferase